MSVSCPLCCSFEEDGFHSNNSGMEGFRAPSQIEQKGGCCGYVCEVPTPATGSHLGWSWSQILTRPSAGDFYSIWYFSIFISGRVCHLGNLGDDDLKYNMRQLVLSASEVAREPRPMNQASCSKIGFSFCSAWPVPLRDSPTARLRANALLECLRFRHLA